MSVRRSIFSAVLALLALANTTSANTEACLPTNEREDGMNINFYEYMLGDTSTYTDPAYMGYGYANTKNLGSVSGQTELSVYYSSPCDSIPTCSENLQPMKRDEQPCAETSVAFTRRDDDDCDPDAAYWSSDLFGFYTTPTNVTVEMTGYFLPPENGSYSFFFDSVDDSAILSVGGEDAFECCEQQQSPSTSTSFTVNGVSGDTSSSLEGSVYLYAGYYYPMKIVFSNANSSATLPVGMTLPNGTFVFDDFEGYVYSFDNNPVQADCTIADPARHTIAAVARTRTLPWTGTYTTTEMQTSTYTGLNGLTTEETIFEIQTPSVVNSSTATSGFTSSSAGPITTGTIITTGTSTFAIPTSSVAASSSQSEIVSSAFSSNLTTSSVATSSTTPSSSVATSSTTPSSSAATSSTTPSSSAASSSHIEIVSSSAFSSNLTTSSVATSSTTPSSSAATSSTAPSSTVAAASAIPSSSVAASSPQSEIISSSAYSSNLTTSSTTISSAQSEITISTVLSDSTISSSASFTGPTFSFAMSSSLSEIKDSSTLSSHSTSSNTALTKTEVTYSSIPYTVPDSNLPTSPTETEVTSSSTATASSTQPRATSSFISSTRSITPMYPSNQTLVTSSSIPTTSGFYTLSESRESSETGGNSISNDPRLSSLDANAHTATTSSDSIEISSAPSQSGTISSSTTPTDLTTEVSETSNGFTRSTSTSGSYSTTTAFASSSSFSTSGSSNPHESAVSSSSSTSSLTTFASSKASESSYTIPLTDTATEFSNNKSESISYPTTYFKSRETTAVSTSVPSLSEPASLLSSSSSSISRYVTSGIKSETASTTAGANTSVDEAFVSPSVVQTISSNEVSSEPYHDHTTTPSVTSVPTKKSETTLVTVTSCESGICSETTSPAVVSTATTTVRGIATEYATWCPISTSESREQTTIVTVTSCESEICSETVSPVIISTARTTVNGITSEYTTWCPISTAEPSQQTVAVTVTSCESGVCSETASPAIVSTATTTINDVVKVYTTWCPITANEESAKISAAAGISGTSTISEATNTKTGAHGNEVSSVSGSNYAEVQASTAVNTIADSNDVSSELKTASTEGLGAIYLSTVSQEHRGTSSNGALVSSTASLEMSSYVDEANGLLTNSAISVFIASVLLAII
ncbi:uncharacterized protein SKDI_06G0150 [Saccharomyces kudriavzevii IFO 1802]|uniref:PA14 domain-containing protein n=1 Tax=Saccharomyces kudriavzevii (strain ATCC MYA-4449 / AS 2.2408 / CBS 8840 / NBRC 1802 / NCYC 2889) TaxID=226230 RepID=A0AA35JGY7_SACK1|nr:uncharacterized protein SKDI_06G0150 [Saccharomyces kudriavzevii IFO 1802]CAI4060779.1 hypothetical protein SKDI_06G0150 [Saccharomyces kudriavzevii IFO 1802]